MCAFRTSFAALVLFAAACSGTAPARRDSAVPPAGPTDPAELVETLVERLSAAIASNSETLQLREVSPRFIPSYERIADEIRSSVQNWNVERLRATIENYTVETDVLILDVRWDLRRRHRLSDEVETLSGRTRLYYRREDGAYRLFGQEGDVLLGRP